VKRLACLCYLSLAILASPTFAHTTPITLRTTSSESFTAYTTGPKGASKSIVLVHDWFGVSPAYMEAADKLGNLGYRVVAVDLYGGQHATTHEQAGALLGALKDDVAARELDTAVRFLSEEGASQGGRKIAVMGFSMGVKHALSAALRNSSVQATVLWYGETVKDPEILHHLGGAALLIVGSHDGPSAAENASAFSKATDAAGVGAEVYVYPGAEHAFAQPLFNQGKTYDPAATGVAWELTESFLSRRLK